MSIVTHGHRKPASTWDFGAGRLLELLSDSQAVVTLEQVRASGIEMPAQAIYTLQLAGYLIDRVPAGNRPGAHTAGYRLLPVDNDSGDGHPERRASSPHEGETNQNRAQGDTR